MRKILIITSHFPPSNLAGVHRSRLFAQHLPTYNWKPIILTIDEKCYEEKSDLNLLNLISPDLQIEKVIAFPITKPRLIGDIGLRAFRNLYKAAKFIIKKEKIDFVLIHVPSFYLALLGRLIYSATKVPYGIDYIDPWVHYFPGSNKIFSRHWFSTQIAKFLEPVAVKNASLISGVAEGYYKPVLQRNPLLKVNAVSGAMPYGGEVKDHEVFQNDNENRKLLFLQNGKIQIVYAGAMLPKAYSILEIMFEQISLQKDIFENIQFQFIGTGKTPDDANGYNIKPLAEKYHLWEDKVFEYPRRIPYLDVLKNLSKSDGILILGTTESHYTPSKSYQAVLSKKPIFAVLHSESSAVNVLKDSCAAFVLEFDGETDLQKIKKNFVKDFESFIAMLKTFDPARINMTAFEMYSAKNVTGHLAQLINQALQLWHQK